MKQNSESSNFDDAVDLLELAKNKSGGSQPSNFTWRDWAGILMVVLTAVMGWVWNKSMDQIALMQTQLVVVSERLARVEVTTTNQNDSMRRIELTLDNWRGTGLQMRRQ